MKHLPYLFFYCLVFFSMASFSQIPEESARQKNAQQSVLTPKRTGDLALAIVAADSPNYIKTLLKPSTNEAPELTKLKTVEAGQDIYISFLVTGVYLNLEKNYHYKVSFFVTNPEGETVFGQRNFASGKGIHPQKPSMYVADPMLVLTFKPEDKKGKYSITARVEDQTNGKTFKNSYELFVK